MVGRFPSPFPYSLSYIYLYIQYGELMESRICNIREKSGDLQVETS